MPGGAGRRPAIQAPVDPDPERRPARVVLVIERPGPGRAAVAGAPGGHQAVGGVLVGRVQRAHPVVRRAEDRVEHRLVDGLPGVRRIDLLEHPVVRRREVRDVDLSEEDARPAVAGPGQLGHVDFVVPDVLDLLQGVGAVAFGQRSLAAPLLVGHHQRPGHVLVGVGGGAAADGLAVHLRGVAAGVDRPVHEAVAVQVKLLVLPEVVEQRLVAHVDGDDQAVADSLGNRRVERRRARRAPAGPRLSAEPAGNRPRRPT